MRKSAAGVVTVGGIAAPSSAQSADPPYYEIERAIHAEVNRRRESRGLAPLAYNANVAAAARAYSRRMATEGFFSHTPPGADSFAAHYRDDGVDCRRLGENILYRTRTADSPRAVAENVVGQWMGSAGHRDNVLGDWRSEGVGVAVTGDGVLYATQGFGSCPGTADASAGGGDENASTETPSQSSATPSSTETPSQTTETPSGGGDDGGTAETVTESDDANASDGWDDDHDRSYGDDERDVAVREWEWDWGWNVDGDDHDR